MRDALSPRAFDEAFKLFILPYSREPGSLRRSEKATHWSAATQPVKVFLLLRSFAETQELEKQKS
jgi:hypothetical protein